MSTDNKPSSLSNKLSITDVDLKGKRVLIRVDFNVPQDDTGKITNPARIVAAIPTIKYALEQQAKVVVLMSHLGRPDGKVDPKYTLRPVRDEVAAQLSKAAKDVEVAFAEDCVGEKAETAVKNAPHGTVVLLENLRFHIEEEGSAKDESGKKIKADPAAVEQFRKQLTSLGDVYINDAFGTAHRAHSSMVGIQLPVRAAGFLMKKELDYFAKALENPGENFLVILGGSKVSDKIGLINNLLPRCHDIIIGGAMAFAFTKHKGHTIGVSKYDSNDEEKVVDVLDAAKRKVPPVGIHLPVDFVVGSRFPKDGEKLISNEEVTEIQTTDKPDVPEGFMGLDIGPTSIKNFKAVIATASTILWNGPPGVFEREQFAAGSRALLDACVEAATIPHGKHNQKAIVIVGGGDTATLVANEGKEDALSHVSTGGGASLELLEGKNLPGVRELSEK